MNIFYKRETSPRSGLVWGVHFLQMGSLSEAI
jgi:hypothetical protein